MQMMMLLLAKKVKFSQISLNLPAVVFHGFSKAEGELQTAGLKAARELHKTF
jgi:hypothetical protein